ncbi:MAG TPA: DNA-binding protein WhiA [Lachnospiraceae bacterium]|nr:DNA-binding protein WhiA [Lachnospiraceae bacterium]
MSFSSKVKAEIAANIPSSRHCRIASIAALLDCFGQFEQEKAGNIRLFLNVDNRDATRKLFTLVNKTINIGSRLLIPAGKSCRETRGRVDAGLPAEAAKELARRLKLLDEDGKLCADGRWRVDPSLLDRSCCKRSFLRDMFLCCGSVNDPRKEYHLEWNCSEKEQVSQLQEVLRSFGKEAKTVLRKKSCVVYFKDSTDIVDLLNLMGATVSMMEMENQRIYKDLRNSVNRRVNCEAANIGKTVSASRKQIEDIRFLEEIGVLRTLPESLRKMAELRMQYPDLPLRELGDRAVPPIGKSGVNHRLRRLTELAGKYREERPAGRSVPDSVFKESVL